MADSAFLTELKAFADTIAEITGKRTDLTTNDKTNLVKAINETKAALSGKQPLHANLTALAGLTAIQPFLLTLLESANLAALQAGLGVGAVTPDWRLAISRETIPPYCTTPLNVGSIPLGAGTYQCPLADIGCADSTYAASLRVVKSDGTILATVGGTAGGLAWRAASAGFTLSVADNVDLTLHSNLSTAIAIVRGARIYQ